VPGRARGTVQWGMAFQASLSAAAGPVVHVEQQGERTLVAVLDGGQEQRASFTTGRWQGAPTLYGAADGALLEVQGQDRVFYRVGRGGLMALTGEQDVSGLAVIAWRDVPDGAAGSLSPMQPMSPMKPMKPLKPM